MTSGLEAVGDAATGAVIAQTVEPGHGRGGHGAPGNCLNCGTALAGTYCHACGQNGHLHRSISGFLHDMLHGILHFEGKIWETLPLLFFKPGELTRRYIAGERAKFVSPIAMFLFSVFLMFAVVGSLAGSMHVPEVRPEDRKRPLAEIEASLAKNKAGMADLRERIRIEERADRATNALEVKLEELERDTEALEVAQRFVKTGNPAAGGQVLGFKTGFASLDQGIAAASENPNLFLYRLQTSAYKYSWLLIPISTPLVWLLFFWKRQYKFYDHLVFVTLSITFMSLLVMLLTVAGWLGLSAGIITLAASLVMPLHLYRQVRGAYSGGRSGAFVRTAALLAFAFVALIAYLLILLALGVLH